MEAAVLAATLLWSFHAGAPADAPPLVVGDRAYYASADKKLYALALADGRKLWARRFKSPLAGPPAANESYVYQYVPFPEAKLYALRADDGHKVWRAAAGPGIVAPAASADYVAVGLGDAVAFYDAATGALKRAHDLGAPVAGAAVAPGAGDGFFVAWTSSGDVALSSPAEDVPRWKRNVVSAGVYVAPAGDRVYAAGADGTAAAYNLRDGAQIWRRDLGDALVGAPAVASGVVVVAARRGVYALGADDGEPAWSYTSRANVEGAAPARDGAVVVGEDGAVVFVSAAAAVELARLGEYGAAAPAAAADLIFAADGVNRLNCYQLR